MGNHSFQHGNSLIERRSSLLSPSNFLHTAVANTMRKGPSFQKATMFTATKLEDSDKPAQLTGGLSLNRQACSKTKPTTSPFYFVQFLAQHVRATSQLRATFATSKSCKGWAIASPDPCSPMSCFHSSCSTKKRSRCPFAKSPPRPACATQPRHMLSLLQLGCWAQTKPASSLRTIGSFFKRKKKSSPYGPVSPWDIPLRRGCAQTHAVPSIQKKPTGPLPTTVASDMTPPHRWSLMPCFHTASSQPFPQY